MDKNADQNNLTKLARLIELSAELDAEEIKKYLDRRHAPDDFIKTYIQAFDKGVQSALMTISREIGKESKQ